MITRRLVVPLTFAAVALHASQAFAQGTFPAPMPDQAAASASNASPFPPANGEAPSASIGGALAPFPSNSDACMTGFAPLREEAEKRRKLINAARERHASPEETCKLIGNFGQSEIKMMKYIEANSATCGSQPKIADQLRASHKNTDAMQTKVCAVAHQAQKRVPAGPVGDFYPTSGPPFVR